MPRVLLVDDAYADQIVALLGSQNIPVSCGTPGGAGVPGGPFESVQSNGGGVFSGFGSWLSVAPAFGIGHQQVMRSSSPTDAATGILVLSSGGSTRLQATYSDDPNPLNQTVNVGLLAAVNNVNVAGNLNFSALGGGTWNANAFGTYGFFSAAPGASFQVGAMQLLQFLGSGLPGSLYSVGQVDSATFAGLGAGGGPFALTGFPLISAAGTGPGCSIQLSAWEQFILAGTGGPGTVLQVSGYETASIAGIGPTSQIAIGGWGAMNLSGSGVGSSRATGGFETITETGIGTPSSAWIVDSFELARIRAIGGVELGPAGASAVRVTPATESSKSPGRVLTWDGTENVYQTPNRTLSAALTDNDMDFGSVAVNDGYTVTPTSLTLPPGRYKCSYNYERVYSGSGNTRAAEALLNAATVAGSVSSSYDLTTGSDSRNSYSRTFSFVVPAGPAASFRISPNAPDFAVAGWVDVTRLGD